MTAELRVVRDDRGRFVPGAVGNPGGRPRDVHRVSNLARQHTDLALRTLAEIAGNRKATPSARVAASEALLNRAWGKPTVAVETTRVRTYEDFLIDIAREQKSLPPERRLASDQAIEATLALEADETNQFQYLGTTAIDTDRLS